VRKINIASTKHAITKIKITGAASPFLLDNAVVSCPTCWGFILRDALRFRPFKQPLTPMTTMHQCFTSRWRISSFASYVVEHCVS